VRKIQSNYYYYYFTNFLSFYFYFYLDGKHKEKKLGTDSMDLTSLYAQEKIK